MDWLEKVWTVRDVMVEAVVSVSPDTPLKRLVDLLWINDVSALPVLDARRTVAGIVTESDLLVRLEFAPGQLSGPAGAPTQKADLYEKLRAASPLTAADVMTTPVVTIRPEATLTDTARLMHTRQLRRLPVVDSDGEMVGMVSQADLLKVFFRSEETLEADVRELVRRRLPNMPAPKVDIEDGVVRLTDLPPETDTDSLVDALDSLPGVVAVQVSS